MAKLTGEELKNAVGNVTERMACADYNTGYSPAAAAVTAPTSTYKPNAFTV